jgi:hypothetical protein
MTDLLSYVRDAENPGREAAEKTKTLADRVWHRIAFQKRSNLMVAIHDDDFVLFQSMMAIKGERREQAEVRQTHLCSCIGLNADYDYAKALLEAGADPNEQGLDGFTPILKLISEAKEVDNRGWGDWLAGRMAMLLRYGANPRQLLSRQIYIWNILVDAGQDPFYVCERLEKNNDPGSPKIKALKKLKTVMGVKAEENELTDMFESAGHDKPGEMKKYTGTI